METRKIQKADNLKAFWNRNIDLFECIGLCLLTSFLTFIYFIVKGDGVFITHADFNVQNIPFTTAMHRAVTEGGIDSFSWNLDLGTSTIQGYSFYNLGSPFFWLSMLFPAKAYPYVVGWMYMLKYTVAGTLAFCYLKRFVQNGKLAIVGGLLYAFSGFSATNLMYQFHDSIAFFPLMLIGLERYMADKKDRKVFVISVAINGLINYFFLVQNVVFLCIYFVVRFWKRDWKENLKNIGGCMMCGILGVGIAAPIFIPGVMHILLGNNQNGSCLYLNNLLTGSIGSLAILKAMLFPAEMQSSGSALEVANYSSTACYLPMFGITFVIAYVRKHKDWLSRILLVLFIMSFSPLLSSTFLLFTGSYHRWWYAFVMMMALASILVLDRAGDYKIYTSALMSGLAVVGMWAVITFIPWEKGYPVLVFRPKLFHIYTLIAVTGVVLCVIGTAGFKRHSAKYMMCCVSVFAIVTTGLTIYEYQKETGTAQEYMEEFMGGAGLVAHDEQYRYISTDNMLVMPGDGAGMGCFTSTRSNAIKKFDDYFDSVIDILSMDKRAVRGLSELLGGKYYVTFEPEEKTPLQEFEMYGMTYYVYEKEACPIGFAVSNFISEESLREVPFGDRRVALLAAALVPEEDMDKVSDILSGVTADTVDLERSVEDYIAENSKKAVHNFDRDANGFTCSTNYREESYVYFSVPFDNDWRLRIDGEKSEIISSGGMMLVRVPAGEHTLAFEYVTPFYRLGMVIALISIAAFAISEVLLRKRYPDTNS